MIDQHDLNVTMDLEAYNLTRDKMYAFIFPNIPQTPRDKAAFEKAVNYQYYHDATLAKNATEEIPAGAQSFSIGDFSMNIDSNWLETRLTRKTICPSAYGVLLRHGLLYRGVEGRC